MNIETRKVVYALYYPILLTGLLWMIKILEFTSNTDLSDYGNYPLSPEHLTGILWQPLIHADFVHLWSNTVPLIFLVWSLFYFYGDIAFRVFPSLWVGSGVLTWFIGRPSFHIGASGIVYGLAFFLFFSGVVRKMRPLMALSGIVAITYGGFVWNMLPVAEIWKPELSWEGHLSGAIVGSALAIVFRKKPPQPPKPEVEQPEEDDMDEYWKYEPEDDSAEEEK